MSGPVIGVLLAGGKSARMGEDKAALVLPGAIDGETLGARAVRVLRAVCDDVVCAGHGRGVPEDVVRIPDAGGGPLVALVGALAHALAADALADAAWFVVLPVDMPGVDAALLARLLALRAASDGASHGASHGARAVCFAVEGVLEPLPLVLAAEALAPLASGVARGERRLGDAVRALAPATIALAGEEADLLQNLNTPADLHAWPSRRAGG